MGFATINRMVSERLGVDLTWYAITDWLGLVAILFAGSFAALGLCQLIQRGSIGRVDLDILLLGAFYLAVIGSYALFEKLVVNYRPVLLDGSLEASYPSSHVMIVVCVMATAIMQSHHRLRSKHLIRAMDLFSVIIIAVTVIGRLVSGVHWLTDMIGGLILSAALIMLYHSATERA